MIHLLFLLPLFFVSSSAFDDDHIAPMIPFDRLDDVAEMMFAYSEKLESQFVFLDNSWRVS